MSILKTLSKQWWGSVFIFFLLLSLPLYSTPPQKLAELIRQKKFAEAETYCPGRKGKRQIECYRVLGDAYLENKNFLKAGECYTKCGYIEGFNRIGEAYLSLEKRVKAVEYFEKGTPSPLRASAYEQLADDFNQKNRETSAKKYYGKALVEYEFLLKTFGYEWKNDYFEPLKRCYIKREQLEKTAGEKEEKALLDNLLKGCGDYCSKMKSWSFHFFCKEKMSETRDYSIDMDKGFKIGRFGLPESDNAPIVKNTYLFEYQLLQEKNKVRESRTLLEHNGKKKNEADAKLQTRGYTYEKLIFGPLALLSRYWQRYFYYKILRKDVLWKEKAVVIEAIPLQYSPNNRLFGTIWISEEDFSVLKIEWQPKALGAVPIEETARLLKAEPSITFYAEFKFKKRGIRFPSRYYLEEAYIDKNGKKILRLKQDVRLDDYMFFVVGTEITETKPAEPAAQVPNK